MDTTTLVIDILIVTALAVVTVWGIVLMRRGDW
jgi:hypothetical protein